jgi:DNA processing protein
VIGVGAAGPRKEAEPAGAGVLDFVAPGWRGLDLAAMDREAERPYWIALSLLPGMGPAGFARALHRFGTAQAAWERGEHGGSLDAAQAAIAATKAAGGRVLTAMDPAYPVALADVDPRPPVLYFAGDPSAFEGPAVAVVGTRRATPYGRATAAEIAAGLARAGIAVVSGLAIGIDGEAHAGAVAAGGPTIAVLPSPLDRIYPPRHRPLAREIVAGGGAVVTELAPGHTPGKPDFARRNRIIAGLAQAVVVVESPDKSGALLTATAATQIGRDLYAVPGPIDSVASRGCNRLIADHQARLVTSSMALLRDLGAPADEASVTVGSLSDAEGLVLGSLLLRPGSIEELAARTQLGAGTLASAITLLEARRLVTSFGGVTFHPTPEARRIGLPS